MTKPLRIGIIGASATGGWARESHVPAIQGLAGLELAAVAALDQPTAGTAAKAFGAKAAYGSGAELIQDPTIDIVAVCVPAPAHRLLVLGALAAGKHVYCEWPLGRSLAEAEELATAAHAAGVHAVVGLEARSSPAAHRARALVTSGAVGRLLSVQIYSATVAYGPKVPASMAFSEKAENGVSLVTIQGAHTLDLAIAVLGGLDNVTALATTQYPEVVIGDNAVRQTRSVPDHLLVQARLAGGAALLVEVAAGRPPEAPFSLKAIGKEGTLTLTGGAPRGFQSGRLHLSLDGKPQPVDEGETASLPDTAANVAGVYASLRDDIRQGTLTAPDFPHAVRLARLIADVLASSHRGARMPAQDWPEA